MSSASIPTQPIDDQGDSRWLSMHERFLLATKEKEPEVLFIGDSIFSHLANSDIWEEMFTPLHALNFSIGGDRTEHVLWRVGNGEVEMIKPKVILLHVGTNNHGNTADEIAEGIMEIVKAITQKQPKASIVIVGLLPRGQNPNPVRDRNTSVNKLLMEFTKTSPNAQYAHIDPGFVQSDGTISHLDLHDYLHLTPAAYRRAFEPLRDLIVQLIAEYDGVVLEDDVLHE